MFVLYVSEIFLEWVCWVLDILRISQDSSGNFRVYSTFTNKINNYPQHSNANWTPLAVRGPQLAPLKTCRVANTIHRNVSKRVANSSNSVSENLVLWHLFVLFCTNWMLVFIRDGQLAPPSKRQLGNQLAPLRGAGIGRYLGMVPLIINPIYTLYHVGIYWVPIFFERAENSGC